ncbi:MAG: outer membrane protein assembly factor BamE, partial [Gammaproteobacteria bacterium]
GIRTVMQKRLLLTLLVSSVLLTGCIKPYTPSIQQGNVISQKDVAQLKLGMSENDVQYLLGQPVLQSTFNNDRWDYIYTYEGIDNGPIKERRLSLFFNDQGNLIKIQDDLTPQPVH